MGNSVVEEIKARLQRHPTARHESGEAWIRVLPDSNNGFIVQLSVDADKYVVSFEGWHEDFERKDDALNCFAFGLSSMCRLKVWCFARLDYKWTVEHYQDGAWVEDSTVGLLAVPSCRGRIRHLQNNLIVNDETP